VLYTGRLADTVAAARAANADSVRPSWSYWSSEVVAEVHDAGLTASSWVVNDAERASRMVDMGLDSLGSDYPDRLRAYLDSVGRSL
jgi:glycerophosphoryl diester phosphodiesterase